MKKQSSEDVAGRPQEDRQPIEEIFTLAEIAVYLKMKETQVRELCRRRCVKPIPTLKAGGRLLRFSKRAVSEWLMQKK
jgi:Helix-turn-helix domain